MQKSFIKINARDISPSDLKAMLSSQIQLSDLTELVEAARHNNVDLKDKSYTETFLTQVKKIIS